MTPAGQGQDSASRDSSSAWRVVRGVIGRRQYRGAAGAASARAEACGDLYRDLARWVGDDGCHALFTRALAQARAAHPALGSLRLRARSEPYVEGVAEAVAAGGDAATAAGLEAMLGYLVELLGRLIGEDMVVKLIEPSLAESEREDAAPPRQDAAADDTREGA